jgi:hypothetical protein
MGSFCERQPDACVVGAQAAVAIGQRAQAGAKMVYEFFNDHASRGTETGSVSKSNVASNAGPKLAAAVRTIPASPGSQNTLKDSDLDAAWQGPVPVRTEQVPLPRKAPTAEGVDFPPRFLCRFLGRFSSTRAAGHPI